MIVKNDYENCLTNFACSIQKYFEIEPKHSTLKKVDNILKEKKPQNVVVILLDGMGSKIIERNLDANSFFRKHQIAELTSVFPATTTAATTSVRTGLNPVEHGYLGWNMYVEPIDETITLFLNAYKGTERVCNAFLKVKNKLIEEKITTQINKEYYSAELMPFGEKKYKDFDDMLLKIKNECQKNGKKYIYAYCDEPDHTMHDLGADSKEVINIIKKQNDKIEKLCHELDDAVVFVIADHGHVVVDHIYLKDYPGISNMLERTTSLEQRAVSLKIKEEFKDSFEIKFNDVLGKHFKLYSKEEVINSKLFGDGKPNELFEAALGDYLAIAENSNKCLIGDNDEVLYSQHAGYLDDEIFVPLIAFFK